MRSFLFVALLTLVGMRPGLSIAQQATPSISLTQYVQILDDLRSELRRVRQEPQKADDLLHDLPPKWHVEVDGQTFEISTEGIRGEIHSWQKTGKAEDLNDAIEILGSMREQAFAADAPVPNHDSQRAALNNILARREFRHVQGQDWRDRLKQRITQLLIRWLGGAFSASVFPILSDVVVYGLMIAAVFALAYWLYRSLRESAKLETIMPAPIPVSAKRWPVWLAEARAAAERGDRSDAVHLAYWAGISFLEAQGLWRPDVARTPREYLRLLPGDSPHRNSLCALTTQFEAVWYSMQKADREQFQRTLAELERLGCVSN